jgi:hypothetical protein
MVTLGDLPGGAQPFSYAFGVSADGKTVVGMGTGEDLLSRAYIWDHQHGLRDLRDVLVGYGLNLNGWRLAEARAVSMFGRTIAGWGVKNGHEQAWITRLPPACPADLDGNGEVGVSDVMLLVASMGPCDSCESCLADVNGDCVVSIVDFTTMMAMWGPCP